MNSVLRDLQINDSEGKYSVESCTEGICSYATLVINANASVAIGTRARASISVRVVSASTTSVTSIEIFGCGDSGNLIGNESKGAEPEDQYKEFNRKYCPVIVQFGDTICDKPIDNKYQSRNSSEYSETTGLELH